MFEKPLRGKGRAQVLGESENGAGHILGTHVRVGIENGFKQFARGGKDRVRLVGGDGGRLADAENTLANFASKDSQPLSF